MKRAVIFDVDGTLVDTREAVYIVMNNTLRRFGYRPITREEYDPFFGKGAYGMSEGVLRISTGSTNSLDEFVKVMSDLYLEDPLQNTQCFSGVPELLGNLHDKSILIGALSNKPDDINRVILESLFDPELFACSMGHREGFPLKPDPSMLNVLLKELGVEPEMCVLIGDTPIDMETAKNVGAMAVGALWGGYDRLALQLAGADFLADIPNDILALFNF